MVVESRNYVPYKSQDTLFSIHTIVHANKYGTHFSYSLHLHVKPNSNLSFSVSHFNLCEMPIIPYRLNLSIIIPGNVMKKIKLIIYLCLEFVSIGCPIHECQVNLGFSNKFVQVNGNVILFFIVKSTQIKTNSAFSMQKKVAQKLYMIAV